MRRNEREVTNKQEIFEILSRCDTIRIGINGEKYPYVIPVSFAYEIEDNKPIIYFHSAQKGLKVDLLEKNMNVCIEGDIFHRIEKTNHGITTRYESVIGYGECKKLDNPDNIINALKLITSRYGYNDYPLDRCKGLSVVNIYKINVESITGKRNLSEN